MPSLHPAREQRTGKSRQATGHRGAWVAPWSGTVGAVTPRWSVGPAVAMARPCRASAPHDGSRAPPSNKRVNCWVGRAGPGSPGCSATAASPSGRNARAATSSPYSTSSPDLGRTVGEAEQDRCAYNLPVLKSALLLRTAESMVQFSGWTLSQRLPLPSSLPNWSSRRNHSSALRILLGWISSSRA